VTARFTHTEFSISAEALDELTVFVNQHGDLYDQGIAFGGVNGVAVKNISGEYLTCVLFVVIGVVNTESE
jgi:hypothetical protein